MWAGAIAVLKCMTCPYKLGTIKCVVNPCIQCSQSGRESHPFRQDSVMIHEKYRCTYCGSNKVKGHVCANCGNKF